jgi:ElaB/YqjD/DUF883 family membrane-anchored ribosome-binding protein
LEGNREEEKAMKNGIDAMIKRAETRIAKHEKRMKARISKVAKKGEKRIRKHFIIKGH